MPQQPPDLIDDAASFETLTGQRFVVAVHFNPASLQYTVSNTLKEEGKGAKKKQYVSQTTARLTMDLVFDTTDSGEDVRVTTDRMARLLQPVSAGKDKNVPPTVKFSWGAYAFTGLVEQYKETLDFFAAGGVPLRASINLTLSSRDVVFESGTGQPVSVDTALGAEPVVMPGDDGPGGAQGAANAAGDPHAARAIAAANGAASLRFGAGAGLAVGASMSASMSAGFAAGGAFQAGADAALLPATAFAAGGGAGAGLGIGAGMSLSAGSSAETGFSALRSQATPSTHSLSTTALLPEAVELPTGGPVVAGGRMSGGGSGGLRAEVGAEADFVIGPR
jgi:hypothetical protein